jgi:alkylation response protein AidB-like acyl-CoA dehydrogenase
MDFTLSDEQVLLRETARALLTKECPTSLVRAHMDDPSAAEPLWRHLREWVVLGDGPLVDLCLFLEECGAVLAPGPYFATSALLLPLARALGDEHADRVADGELTGTVAWAGVDGSWTLDDPAGSARAFVLEADRVDRVAVRTRGAVRSVPAADLAPRRVGSLDSTRRLFEVEVDGSADGSAAAPDVFERWLQRATVALAAELLGTARTLLERSIQYAKERVQFDQPIGSFQAIQHKLADMALAVERGWSAVYYAAMCIDADDPARGRATHVAKAAAGAAATRAAKDGIQIHGGIGYTWEHDLHLFIRRAYASEHLMGTQSWNHDRLAELLLG